MFRNVDQARTVIRKEQIKLRAAQIEGNLAAILLAESQIEKAERYIENQTALEHFDIDYEDGPRPRKHRAGHRRCSGRYN